MCTDRPGTEECPRHRAWGNLAWLQLPGRPTSLHVQVPTTHALENVSQNTNCWRQPIQQLKRFSGIGALTWIFWLDLSIHVMIQSIVLFPQNKHYYGQLLQCQFARMQRVLNMWGGRFLQDRWLLLVVARCRQSLACTRTGLWESGLSVEVEVGLGELHIQLCFLLFMFALTNFFVFVFCFEKVWSMLSEAGVRELYHPDKTRVETESFDLRQAL